MATYLLDAARKNATKSTLRVWLYFLTRRGSIFYMQRESFSKKMTDQGVAPGLRVSNLDLAQIRSSKEYLST